jgi:hypothetical protein
MGNAAALRAGLFGAGRDVVVAAMIICFESRFVTSRVLEMVTKFSSFYMLFGVVATWR